MKTIIAALILIASMGCSAANVDYIKERARRTWDDAGYQVVGYRGYIWWLHVFPTYGGAKVFYLLKKKPDNGILYTGSLLRWGDELHMHNIKAIDAIKP